MKRILIITLALIFGLSAAGLAAGTFSGRWATDITIITCPQTPVFGVSSVLTVNYAVAGWTFGSVSTLTEDGWTEQDFRADGALGAFTLTNLLRFDPTEPEFEFLRSTAAVQLAGVDFESRFLIVEGGSGLRLRVGDWPAFMRATAYFGALAFDPADEWAPGPLGHTLEFRGLDLDFRVPFHSFILEIDADFTCSLGFEDLMLTVPALPLGIPGLTAGLRVHYRLEEDDKRVLFLTPTVVVAPWVHFQPFIGVFGLPADIGLRLDGLRMVWAGERVTFTYEWDALQGLPRIAGRRPAGISPRLDYQQRIMIRSVMAPITFDAAFAWLHGPAPTPPALPVVVPMPMFPQDIDLDVSVVVMPGLSLRTGIALRYALPLELSFGFTVDW